MRLLRRVKQAIITKIKRIKNNSAASSHRIDASYTHGASLHSRVQSLEVVTAQTPAASQLSVNIAISVERESVSRIEADLEPHGPEHSPTDISQDTPAQQIPNSADGDEHPVIPATTGTYARRFQLSLISHTLRFA